jgi:hypothetical protein
VSSVGRPDGADLLHLCAPWRQGATIVAGLATFPPAAPVPQQFFANECTEDGCQSLIIAGSHEQLAERTTQHGRRCHG